MIAATIARSSRTHAARSMAWAVASSPPGAAARYARRNGSIAFGSAVRNVATVRAPKKASTSKCPGAPSTRTGAPPVAAVSSTT